VQIIQGHLCLRKKIDIWDGSLKNSLYFIKKNQWFIKGVGTGSSALKIMLILVS